MKTKSNKWVLAKKLVKKYLAEKSYRQRQEDLQNNIKVKMHSIRQSSKLIMMNYSRPSTFVWRDEDEGSDTQ